jgi:hypothetical protein
MLAIELKWIRRITKGGHQLISFFMHDLPQFGKLTPDGNIVSCLLQQGTLHVHCLQTSQGSYKKARHGATNGRWRTDRAEHQRHRTRLSRVQRSESVATDVSNSGKRGKQQSEVVGAAAGHEETYFH